MGKFSPLSFAKHLTQWTLIFMILYSSHLGLRDSDKSTYEIRIRETLKFLESNDQVS